jgi:hypothetical protein
MDLRTLLLAALFVMGASGPAQADGAAGIVKRLQGTVTLQRGEAALPVAAGTPVQVGDRLTTGGDGAVGITLADDTLLTAGPGSTLVISEFRFDSTTNEGNLLARLLKGTLHVVTGLIAKQAPQNVNVQTRNAVMGVRGTEFIVDVRSEAP